MTPANYLGTAPTAKHEDRRGSAQVCLIPQSIAHNSELQCLDRELNRQCCGAAAQTCEQAVRAFMLMESLACN